MGAHDSLKSLVRQYIKTNGQNEITGQILQNVLIAMIDDLGITIDPQPTKDSSDAVASGGAFNMIQDATNVNATLSEDGKIYNDYNAGDIFYIEQDDVRKYRVAYAAGTADAEHPVTINGTLFYYADNASDAIWLSLRIKTVSTEQQSLSAQQKAHARTNIAAVSYDQQSLNADQQVNAQNNMMGKAYAPAQHSGLGKVYLAKNNGVLTQAMMQATNTVYVIQYDYAISANITIPAGCTLEFDGGSISGSYTITLSNTLFTGDVRLKKGLKLAGTLANEEAYSDWYEIAKDGTVSWVDELNCLIDVCSGCLMFGNGTYLITGTYNGDSNTARAQRNGLHVKSNFSYIGSSNTIIKQDYSAYYIFTTGFRFKYSTEYLKNNIVSVENVVFKNLTLKGAYEAFVQYSHLLDVESVDGLIVENCKFFDWRGDAICIGWTTAITQEVVSSISKNIEIKWCVFDAIHNEAGTRQAISVTGTTTENVVIRDNSFSNLGRTDMPGAVDFELEGLSGDELQLNNITVSSNTFTNILGNVGIIAVQKSVNGNDNVTISSNIFDSDETHLAITVNSKNVKILDNTMTGLSVGVILTFNVCQFANNTVESNAKNVYGFQFTGNTDATLFMFGNKLKNLARSLNGGGFCKLTSLKTLAIYSNVFENVRCDYNGTISAYPLWFYQSNDVSGVIHHNLTSNNVSLNKPTGVTEDSNIVFVIS